MLYVIWPILILYPWIEVLSITTATITTTTTIPCCHYCTVFQLLKPLESAKKEAQYLFSSHAARTVVNIARGLGASKVLCLGTPRIHELLCSEMSSEMDSLLLDMDHRFVSQRSREFLSFCIMWQVVKSSKSFHFIQFLPSNIVTLYLWSESTHLNITVLGNWLLCVQKMSENLRYLFGFMWISLMAVAYEEG